MHEELLKIGWQNHFEEQVDWDASADVIAARVAAHHGAHVVVLTPGGELSLPLQLLEATQQIESAGFSQIAVGDWFLLEKETYRAKQKLERKSLIERKAAGATIKPQLIAANVDTVFIVSSCNKDFNLSRFERYLALVSQSGAQGIVILTKKDLHDDPYSLRQQVEKLQTGLIVELMDARCPEQVSVLDYWCKSGKTIALLGSSGVGKSTLANTLCGINIVTQAIRNDDDKGRHTTTSRALHKLLKGGWLIDNPGMRELQLSQCGDGIEDVFDDIVQFSQECRFRDCAHQGDQGCGVEAAVNDGRLDARRLTSYLKLQNEQKRNSETMADRREKERKQGKFYKRVISDKKKLKRLQ